MAARTVQLLLVALVVLLILNLRSVFSDDDTEEYTERIIVKEEVVDGALTMIDKPFDVDAGDLLNLDVSHADVIVETGSSNEARVRVLLRARDMDRARVYFEDMRFQVEQRGDEVIVATHQQRRNWSHDGNGGAHIVVHIALPERFDADVSVAHGDVEIDRLDGRIDIEVAHGDMHANDLRGSAVAFSMAHGDLNVEALESQEVELRAAHGDINFGRIIASRFQAESAHGDVHVDEIEGHAEVMSAHGDVALRFTKAAGFDLRNSHGDIDVVTPAGIPGELQLSGGRVEVDRAFRVEGTVKHDRAEGTINGGGPLMEAHTSHGSIRLRAGS